MLDDEFFGEWIDARLLREGALDPYRARFRNDPAGLVVVERFLREDVAARLAGFFMREAEYRRVYGLYGTDVPMTAETGEEGEPRFRHEVNEEQFSAASDKHRFYTYSVLNGAHHGVQFTPGLVTFLKFRANFCSERFITFFSALAGRPVGATVFEVHAMGKGDYLRLHDDAVDSRLLAFIIYLTPDWDMAHGGRLVLVDSEGERPIGPSFNTLVVFDVKSKPQHYVEPIQPGAGSQLRICIGGWITDPARIDS